MIEQPNFTSLYSAVQMGLKLLLPLVPKAVEFTIDHLSNTSEENTNSIFKTYGLEEETKRHEFLDKINPSVNDEEMKIIQNYTSKNTSNNTINLKIGLQHEKNHQERAVLIIRYLKNEKENFQNGFFIYLWKKILVTKEFLQTKKIENSNTNIQIEEPNNNLNSHIQPSDSKLLYNENNTLGVFQSNKENNKPIIQISIEPTENGSTLNNSK